MAPGARRSFFRPLAIYIVSQCDYYPSNPFNPQISLTHLTMRVLLFGASRNTGYFVAHRLLAKGHTCTFLLRKPEALESDFSLSGYISSGKAKLVRGDGLVQDDVQRVWNVASSEGPVDLVFFGIGGEPSFSLTKGFVITPPDLTTRSMSVLLSVLQSSTTPATQPKLITISSNGLDEHSHSLLPLPMKAFYGYFLRLPHEDKLGLEKNVQQAAGWGDGQGWFDPKNIVIVRPAFLINGKCAADEKPDAYRTGDELNKAWGISRADVGHFVVEKVIADWEKWAGKAWVVSY
ncbi:unnamed protein product [Rhizoctonia solani]|uniref:NAD(P)H-binding family protein n=1 Tax=Rhizoctonia solani AG-3 Rhs1AP TaxID=1086054 RepID=X8JAP3_9AGAM|nr:NAD(P)H-binding family protein [Rhizoctonia solani AG-3 Rhs1AP]CAE6375313.1 unnamed protein product [Rhizoctonia solani]